MPATLQFLGSPLYLTVSNTLGVTRSKAVSRLPTRPHQSPEPRRRFMKHRFPGTLSGNGARPSHGNVCVDICRVRVPHLHLFGMVSIAPLSLKCPSELSHPPSSMKCFLSSNRGAMELFSWSKYLKTIKGLVKHLEAKLFCF